MGWMLETQWPFLLLGLILAVLLRLGWNKEEKRLRFFRSYRGIHMKTVDMYSHDRKINRDWEE